METSTVTSATQATTTAQTESSSSSRQIAADFETFLSLLTAQMENQDPLEPLESTEFVAQLAQFSAVEQQVATNTKFDDVIAMLSGAGASDMAQWIGQEVEAPVALEFRGDPLILTTDPDPEATSATLVVSDLAGNIVAATAVDPSASDLVWDGSTPDGDTADEGFYNFTVTRNAGDQALEDDIPRGFASVTEVRLDGVEHQLIVSSGQAVVLEEVSAVRASQSETD